MIYTCQLVVARSMWLNVPLRGAISYGECIVSTDPIYYLGRPILEAYELEKRQEWAGVSLCPSAAERVDPESENRIISWDVPVKGGWSSKVFGRGRAKDRMFAVDWPAASTGPVPAPDWQECFDSLHNAVIRKRSETQRFFEIRKAGPMIGGPQFGPVHPDELRRWRELYQSLYPPP
jgi:hypothetical protein